MPVTINGSTGLTSNSGSVFTDASGNVGIGTGSPGRALDIIRDNNSIQGLRIRNDSNGSSSEATLIVNAFGNSWGIGMGSSANNSNAFTIKSDIQGSPTERMRIRTDGGILSQPTGGGTLIEQFGCRAWVNFNGTGTVAIRASGNVSSITDNSSGNYTVNFSTAMPDGNYSAVAFAQDAATKMLAAGWPSNSALSASNYRLTTSSSGGGSAELDSTYVFVAIFR
jgi:hypothetical protein